jgi:hypothetical protein
VSASEGRCRALCEASKACLTPAQALLVNCYTSCDDLEAVNRANECHDEVDAYYDCIDRHGVCADLTDVCGEQEAVYSDCLADQCSNDPDRDICF